MTGLLVVTNPAAGTTSDATVAAALAVLRAGAEVTVVSPESASELASVLGGRGDRIPVMVGGDGSLHLAVSALRSSGSLSRSAPIGLIPLGTGNDLARTMGIPLDPAAAADVVLRGRARTLDLVVDDDGGAVVNAVHLGVGAEAAERASEWKDAMGKAAYVAGSAVAGATAKGWDVTVTVDGSVLHSGPALMVGVANGRSIGGGAPLAPSAEPDDGVLDVVVATSVGPLARLGFATALRGGEHVTRDDVLAVQGRSVTVSGEPFPLNADGELSGPVAARTWTVEAEAWSLLVP